MNKEQGRLIRKAHKEYGNIIFPINGSSFCKEHFTKRKDKQGVSWMLFWFTDKDLSSHIVQLPEKRNDHVDPESLQVVLNALPPILTQDKSGVCRQCGLPLTYDSENCKGHCTPCEQRGI